MHIKLVGFKCHLDTHYDFNTNSMILLKGESSAGKSTILQAIYWALYGSMRNIYNNKGLVKKCSVTLQINQLIIYRQKRPELLRVTIVHNNEEQTYEDDVAQQIIVQAFGSKNLWKSCSYIVQKKRCSLLSGSAAERLDLLNQMSFDQDTPKDYIVRIDQELKLVNNQFIELQTSFTNELNLFTQGLTTRPVTVTLTQEEITNLKDEIKNLESEVTRLYQEVLNHERNIGSYNMICEQIKSSEDKLNNLHINPFDEEQHKTNINSLNDNIQGYRNILTNANHYSAIKQQVSSLETSLNNNEIQLNNIVDQIETSEKSIQTKKDNLLGYDLNNQTKNIHLNLSNQDIWQVTQQETSRNKFIVECQQLGCEYNQEVINSIIIRLQKQITDSQNMERNLHTYNQLKNLKQQIASLGVSNVTTEQITELENTKQQITLEISELKKGLELLQCPECSKPLRYVNMKLVPAERDPVDPIQIQNKETEYRNILNQISTLRSVLTLSNQIKTTESHLEGVDINMLETYKPFNTAQTQGYISRLSRIQIIELPQYSSNLLKQILEYNQSVQNITNLNNNKEIIIRQGNTIKTQLSGIQLPNSPGTNIGEIKSIISNSQLEINKLHDFYQKHLQLTATYNQLQITITQLTNQRDNKKKLLNPNAKIIHQTTQQMLQQSKKKLTDGIYGNSVIEVQKNLSIKREKVMILNEDLTALQRLKQNAIEVECKQLLDTVDTINSVLCDILPLFFDKPITMVLKLYKILKTKKQIKPGLNISVKCDGVEYNEIDQMSGGEGDRVSLALVLSLNSVSNSPIILLDECISSLDGVNKESCVEAMKTLEGKTIICVDHEGVEGFYDNTITVSH